MTYETVPLQQLLREIAERTASPEDADAIRLAADTLDSLEGKQDWTPMAARLPEHGVTSLQSVAGRPAHSYQVDGRIEARFEGAPITRPAETESTVSSGDIFGTRRKTGE
jgi:hypothetical protein